MIYGICFVYGLCWLAYESGVFAGTRPFKRVNKLRNWKRRLRKHWSRQVHPSLGADQLRQPFRL